MSLLAELGNSEAKRSKSGYKLAAYVLQSPEVVIGMPIAQLASAVGVSEPTVNRFCTGLGLRGFPDFKLALAGELARQQPCITRNIAPGDSTSHVIAKLFESTQASIIATRNLLDPVAVDRAINALFEARSIILCGLGASASVAMDAQNKLLRFPTPVIAHVDVMNQRMTATGLDPQDCLVCISYTGRTKDMVEVAQLGREAGAIVIGITTPNSPLARNCDLVLAVETGEDTDFYTPMTSRIAQLVVIDVLASRLAIKQGPAFMRHLKRVKQSVTSTRYPRKDC